MGRQSKPTYADILRKRGSDRFVGRDAERRAFRRNLEQIVPDSLIFWIQGEEGIGKSSLVQRFQEIAREYGAATALTNEAEAQATREPSILQAMGRLARELSDVGTPLPEFERRYDEYSMCVQEAEADRDVPAGVFELFGRKTAWGVAGATGTAPRGRVAPGLAVRVRDVGWMDRAGRERGYGGREFKNKEQATLVRDPVGILTPLFVEGVNRVAEECPVVLCFDDWERTGGHLGEWLRGVLTRQGLSSGVWLVVAAREDPEGAWRDFAELMACSELKAFSDEETREYLRQQGIDEEARAQQIVDLTRGVPVLVSTLASVKGESAADAAQGVVERYLTWLDDTQQRQVVLACAAARWFDRELLGEVMRPLEGVDVAASFEWVTHLPFVERRPGYWAYHSTVRRLMLEYARARLPSESEQVHDRLWRAHQDRMLERGDGEGAGGPAWRRHRTEALYHRLMPAGDGAVTEGLEAFVGALRDDYPLAGEIAAAWMQAAEDQPGETDVGAWATLLCEGWTAIQAGDWRRTLPLVQALKSHTGLSAAAQCEVFCWGGIARYDVGDALAAVADFDRAIDLNPECAATFLNRGLAHKALGDLEAAMGDYDRAIEQNPWYAAAYNNRGVAEHELGDLYAAIADFDRAIALDPEDATAFYNRGNARKALGDLLAAVADLDRAIELDRDYATAYNNRGVAHHELGDLHGAIADFDRAIMLNPEYAQTYNNRGVAHYELGRLEAAVADCDRAIGLDPGYAKAYYNRGVVRYDLGELQAAVADYDRTVELDPEDATAFYNRGVARYDLRDLEGAVADYDRAIALDPDDPSAYYNRGVARYDLGDLGAAVADFDRSIELNPEDASVYHNRGNARYDLGELQAAVEDFDRAIELDPQDAPAFYNRGLAHQALCELPDAVADFDRAIDLDPEYAAAFYNRANTRYDLGEVEAAVGDYDRAIELNPDDATAYNNRGNARYDLGDLQGAVADYERAIGLDAGNAFAYNNLASVHLDMGRVEDAVPLFEHRIALAPASALAAQVSLGVVKLKQGDEAGARERFVAGLDVWERTQEAGILSEAGVLEYRALAHLGLGQRDEALRLLREALEAQRAGCMIEFTLYNLLAQAPVAPDGLVDMRAMLEEAAVAEATPEMEVVRTEP